MENKKQIIKAIREDLIRLGSIKKEIRVNEKHNCRLHSILMMNLFKEFNIKFIPWYLLNNNNKQEALRTRYIEVDSEIKEKSLEVPYEKFVLEGTNDIMARRLISTYGDVIRKHLLTSMHILYNKLRNTKRPHLDLKEEGSEFEYFKYADTINKLIEIYTERVESETEVCEDA